VVGVAADELHRTVDAVWRIEAAKIVATLAGAVGDVGLAEDLAQEALVDALTHWRDASAATSLWAGITTTP
jgi:predicted RNA polymerase sigma factor